MGMPSGKRNFGVGRSTPRATKIENAAAIAAAARIIVFMFDRPDPDAFIISKPLIKKQIAPLSQP
jgi:hypothetical protein